VTPQELIERALAASTTSDCIVIAHEESSANLRFAGNTLTTNGVSRTRSVTVIAIDGDRTGVVTRRRVTLDDIGDVVADAERAAQASGSAEDVQPLVGPDASTGSWTDEPAITSIGVFENFAPALGAAFREAEAAGHLLYGYAEHGLETVYVGSSTGLRARHDQPSGRFELTGRSPDGSRSGWSGQSTHTFADVDVAAHATDVARRLEWAQRRIDLPAGRYDTLLPPSAVADLMVYLHWSSGALDSADGRTVFSKPGGGTRIGEKLSPLPLTLDSDPAMPGQEMPSFTVATASGRETSIFDNGLPLSRTPWIEDGVLRSLIAPRFVAARTGVPVAPLVGNLRLTAGATESLETMIGQVDRGLLLTCLWYIRTVDPQTLLLTGLTRDGVFLVEGGEVVGAVNNFRFNESPVSLLGRAAAAGEPSAALPREFGDYFQSCIMPPLRIPDFNMSSVSKAS
jgi:predicted Zn-dependent protease